MGEPDDKAKDTYAVGYRKPPAHSRFRKGQSGNPSGKARASKAERAKDLLCQELYRLLSVREGGKLKRIPALHAVVRRLVAAAAQGNLAAQRTLLRNIQEIEAERRAEQKAARQVDTRELSDEQLIELCRGEDHG